MQNSGTGQFEPDSPSWNRAPIGTVRIQARRGSQRAYVKTARSKHWELRARAVWKSVNGPIPAGMGIHHRDGDKLNDSIENLEMVSKAEHLAIHRHEHDHKASMAALTAARRERRWSTKSATKRTGRPPTWDPAKMALALASVEAGARYADAAREFGVKAGAIWAKRRRESKA